MLESFRSARPDLMLEARLVTVSRSEHTRLGAGYAMHITFPRQVSEG